MNRDLASGANRGEISGRVRSAERSNALDITKGLLVVLMVVYHTINYSTQYFLAFRYMAFLPPTFIIITGFLLTRVYGAKSRESGVNSRLLIRGVKLLLLFAILNVGAQFVRSENYHGQAAGLRHFIVHWPDTFLVGGSRAAVFEILLPIAYLLICAPALLWLDRIHRFTLPFLTVVVLAGCTLSDRTGTALPNLYLLAAGLIGMLIGRLSWASLGRFKQAIIIPIGAYAVYAVAVAEFGQSLLLQLSGSTVALATIYGGAIWIDTTRWPAAWLTRLGHYSLWAYVVQIAILQVLSHLLGRPAPFSAPFYALMVGTLLLTAFSTEIIHWTRARVRAADYLYRMVFP